MPPKSKSVVKKSARPQVIRAIAGIRKWRESANSRHETVALVPTMGALHAGHLALVRLAKRRADRVVVSIFVNPTQFAPTEDLASYPRTWDADVAALSQLQVDAIWAPSVSVMYPDKFSTNIAPAGPALANLEDKFRPHFFGGVCTVVAKLFLQVAPDFTTFGEKDYQQLKVVTAMARDLDIPTRILGLPTVREKDGLALSSRNAYLSPGERAIAPTLNRVLKECAVHLKAGQSLADVLPVGRAKLQHAGFLVDYLEARHAETLAPVAGTSEGPTRLLVAAKLGRTRLIDNIGV